MGLSRLPAIVHERALSRRCPALRAAALAGVLACAFGVSPASGQVRPPARPATTALPSAQPDETNGWASLRVPGGTAALLRAAGVTETEPRMRALLAVIRSVHDVGPGIDQAADQRRTRFEGYL